MRRGKSWILILALEIGAAAVVGAWFWAKHRQIDGDPKTNEPSRVTDSGPTYVMPRPEDFMPKPKPPASRPARPERRAPTSRPERWGEPSSAPTVARPEAAPEIAPGRAITRRRPRVVNLTGRVKTGETGRPARSLVEAVFQSRDADIEEYRTMTDDDGAYAIPCRTGEVDVVISVTPVWATEPVIVSLDGEVDADHAMNDVAVDEPVFVPILVQDDKRKPIAEAGIHLEARAGSTFSTDASGRVTAAFSKKKKTFLVSAIGYETQTVTLEDGAADKTTTVQLARDTRVYFKVDTIGAETFTDIAIKCSSKAAFSDVACRSNDEKEWRWLATDESEEGPLELPLGSLDGPGGFSVAGIPSTEAVKFTFRWQRLEYTTNVTLRAGEWKDVVVKLPWKYPKLAGRVFDGDTPIADAVVRIHRANDTEVIELRTDKDGAFATPWPNGADAEAIVSAHGFAPRAVRVTTDGGAAANRIVLGPERSMVLKIEDADGLPVDPDRVLARWSFGETPGQQTTVGEYEFRDLPGDLVVLAATLGMDEHVLATTEETSAPVLRLPPLGAARIEWPHGTFPHRVKLESPDGPARAIEHVITKEEKRRDAFTQKGLMPGRYRATLLDPKGKRIGRWESLFVVEGRRTSDATLDEPPITPEVK